MNIQHYVTCSYKNYIFQQFPVTWEKAYIIMVSENVGYKFYIKYLPIPHI